MSLRDLATTACDPTASSSNPLTALTNALLPSSATPSAHAQSLRDGPRQQLELSPAEQSLLFDDFSRSHQSAVQLHPPPPPPNLADAFLNSFPPPPQVPAYMLKAPVPDFEAAFGGAAPASRLSGAAPAPLMTYRPLPRAPHARPYIPPSQFFAQQMHPPAAYASASQAPPMQSSVQEAQRDAVSADKQQTIPTSTSWGDEFTSFETAGLDAVADDVGNIADAFDRFAFDDVEGAFQQWLRRDDTSYSFEHVTESQDGRTAEQALKEGITHREEGRLKKAVACFEEALNNSAEGLQKERRATAWYLLGLSLAETDDDERAIRALSQGLTEWNGSAVGERRVDNPHAWQSLIALSVSYTNELEVGSALRCIREWLDLWKSRHSGDAEAGIPDVAPSSPATMAHEDLLDRLTTASAANPGDVDLYVVTGILHNLNREYRLAADAFRHAVGLRPGDPSLWNKLGATLANGGESDDALRAYRKTVDINPSMIRAWVNVGTAYSNRSEFAKATRYYLKAIAMTEERELGRDDDMLHVWGYLRTSLVSMSRPDILHLVDARDVSAFREHFSF